MCIRDRLLFSHKCKATLIAELRRTAASMLWAIQYELECSVAVAKAAVLATSVDIQKKLAKQ
eukprot:7583515-Pyramimonas_sp.AAC.1